MGSAAGKRDRDRARAEESDAALEELMRDLYDENVRLAESDRRTRRRLPDHAPRDRQAGSGAVARAGGVSARSAEPPGVDGARRGVKALLGSAAGERLMSRAADSASGLSARLAADPTVLGGIARRFKKPPELTARYWN
jgi:hypothetical protein